MYKSYLFAIALSPFLLNAELHKGMDTDFEEEEEETPYFSMTEEQNEEDGTLLYEDEDYLADEPNTAEHSSSQHPEDPYCHSPYHVMHAGMRHSEAKGVGYKQGYTTLEAFGIYNGNSYFMPFLDLRGHVFNDGKLAGNVGIGERSALSSINHLFGIYCYYDVRQENHDLTVNQVSPGIELLGKRMEYRLNGYFPVGKDKSHHYGYKFDRFDGHHILLKSKQKAAFTGGDAEVGVHVTQSTRYDLYAGAGPYYFSSSHASSWGGKARLLGRYREYVSLEATYSYDHLFGSIIQGSIGFSYPFGGKLKRKGGQCPQQNDLMLSRAAFAPYRFEIPVVKKVTRRKEAINPATDAPWQVWFVNNTSSSAGTFESPFPTLVQAQNASAPNDMIYVFPGDGTTTGMNQGIVLQDGQKLLGSGIAHPIPTTRGRITIPPYSTTAPTLTNTASVVTLANGNQVSGLNISVTTMGTNGIDGGAGVSGAVIDHNFISGNVIYNGISVNSNSGLVRVNDNQLVAPVDTITNSMGIHVRIVDGYSAQVKVSDNAVTGYGTAISCGPLSNPTTSSATTTVANNVVNGFGNVGIYSPTGMANSFTEISNNSLTNSSSVGSGGGFNASGGSIIVSVNLAPESGTYVIENNTIVTTTPNPAVWGILGQINIATGASAHMSIKNNNVQAGSGAGSTGITEQTVAQGNICTEITGNRVTLQAAGTNGISLLTIGNGMINIDDFTNNVAPSISATGNVNLVDSCNP